MTEIPLNKAVIRAATADDDPKRIASLIMMSAEEYFPFVFGPAIEKALQKMFHERNCVFNHRFITVVEVDGTLVGAAVSFGYYSYTFATILSFARHCFREIVPTLFRTLRCVSNVGNFGRNEYYLSNAAVDSRFRGRGLFSGLHAEIERKAKKEGYRKIALDVETEKEAVNVYRHMGYEVQYTIPLVFGKNAFSFYRMSKEIGNCADECEYE